MEYSCPIYPEIGEIEVQGKLELQTIVRVHRDGLWHGIFVTEAAAITNRPLWVKMQEKINLYKKLLIIVYKIIYLYKINKEETGDVDQTSESKRLRELEI